MNHFLKPSTTEDEFNDMVACCFEAWSAKSKNSAAKAAASIDALFRKQRRDENTLYNPYRNISLNQCIGDSTQPVSDWLNASAWREWD